MLDARLQAVMDLVPQCEYAADIGADHGLLACELLLSGRCARMAVADVSPLALRRAETTLTKAALLSRVDLRVADGLSALTQPAQAIIVAGMGAETIIGILEQGSAQRTNATLILQTNTEHALLRVWLAQNGYRLTHEKLAHAAGRFYVIMRAEIGQATYTAEQLELGPCLLQQKPPLWRNYLAWRTQVTRRALADLSLAKREDAAQQAEKLHALLAMLEQTE